VRILVVEDDATSRVLLKAMASKLGHDCLVASDGSSAWELLQRGAIDVLLPDWMMPGVDGLELCRRIRHELTDSYTYVVIVTGRADPKQILEAMKAGADDYLVKPVNSLEVRTSLVAAQRVTSLHRQLNQVQAQLEEANLELQGRSLTDSLTNLGNRRRMEEDLLKVHARALRSEQSYCVTMFDIDYFKSYNDHYGHLAGDDALRQVARCLGRVVRAGESVYRYGGEEFLLVMPDCRVDDAVAAAERVLHTVNLMSITHEARPSVPLVITLSAGVACHTPDSDFTVHELIERADQALYNAKLAGRNRVRSTVPDVPHPLAPHAAPERPDSPAAS
jgi:two-component system, cell cycle response regulator